MKILSFLFIIAVSLSNKACSQQASEFDKVTFSSRTRGASKYIEVSASKIRFELNGIESSKELMDNDWLELVAVLESANPQKIATYTSKKKDRARDAAMHSTIAITIAETAYTSQTFDNEDAPKELAAVMSFLIKLDKKYNKGVNQLF